MTKYIELTIHTTHDGGDLVADILSEYTEEGVAISDIEDVIDLEKKGKTWDYADEDLYKKDKTVLVKAYFKSENAAACTGEIEKRLIELKKNSPFDLGSLEAYKREIDGDLWREQWKEHFKPIHIGRIVVVPEWIKYDKKPKEETVIIGSNMAFGTGEHETTSMCVEFLEKYVNENDVVLDVGCGSGILGIAASKLGAKKVVMTDIDECAYEASLKNCELNGVKNAEVLLKNLLDDNTVKGDVIVCNIMAEVLIAFAPKIGDNLKENGVIILSGILTDRKDKVRKAYEDAEFVFDAETVKGEWAAMAFRKGV